MRKEQDKKFNDSLEKERVKIVKPKKETEMKTPKINPELKGALKVVIVLAVIAFAVYAGWELRGNDNQRITVQAEQLATKLKTNQ